jgi:uncharacterized protein YndB with AHSA1/START domain
MVVGKSSILSRSTSKSLILFDRFGYMGDNRAAERAQHEIGNVTKPTANRASTRVSKIIKAPRKAVYQACLDPDAVTAWRAPDNMKGHMHAIDAREGGAFRMSLTYQNPKHSPGGKTSGDTDTFHGRFVELIPYEKIVEVVEFESDAPRFAGEMKITTSFADTDEGTEITVLCEDIPAGIRPEDNEMGTKSSLKNLASLFE